MEIFSAQLMLLATDGTPLVNKGPPSDTEAWNRLRPTDERIDAAVARMRSLGFDVGSVGAVSITISGERALFEEAFDAEIVQATDGMGSSGGWAWKTPIVLEAGIKDVVSDVVFTIAPVYY